MHPHGVRSDDLFIGSGDLFIPCPLFVFKARSSSDWYEGSTL